MTWQNIYIGTAGSYPSSPEDFLIECREKYGYGSTREAIIGLFRDRIRYECRITGNEQLLEIDCDNLFEVYVRLYGEPYHLTYDVELNAREFIEYQINVMLLMMNKSEKEAK